jgi:hypothetical protein
MNNQHSTAETFGARDNPFTSQADVSRPTWSNTNSIHTSQNPFATPALSIRSEPRSPATSSSDGKSAHHNRLHSVLTSYSSTSATFQELKTYRRVNDAFPFLPFHAELSTRYEKPWLDKAKREPNWDAATFYTATVLAFCGPKCLFVECCTRMLTSHARYWSIPFIS